MQTSEIHGEKPNKKIKIKSFQEISKNCGKGSAYCEGQSVQCNCDKIWKNQYGKSK